MTWQRFYHFIGSSEPLYEDSRIPTFQRRVQRPQESTNLFWIHCWLLWWIPSFPSQSPGSFPQCILPLLDYGILLDGWCNLASFGWLVESRGINGTRQDSDSRKSKPLFVKIGDLGPGKVQWKAQGHRTASRTQASSGLSIGCWTLKYCQMGTRLIGGLGESLHKLYQCLNTTMFPQK